MARASSPSWRTVPIRTARSRSCSASDGRRETRQLGVVAADGRSAAWTGSECNAWAGHETGEGFAAQGNILAGADVVADLAEAFRETSGSLAERLVAGLEAAQAAGGDSRGQQSASVYVERSGAGMRDGRARRPRCRPPRRRSRAADRRAAAAARARPALGLISSGRAAIEKRAAGRGGRRAPDRAREPSRRPDAALRPRLLRGADGPTWTTRSATFAARSSWDRSMRRSPPRTRISTRSASAGTRSRAGTTGP